ncbi:hypothetical protein [Pseudomonas indica]|uniref:hypothetical protein n=1 Tax=Pseudomonas indica TaxID=137658 RepID=UPI000BAC0B29|nr:hypothetical protein [Pseudomonas indica]PAU61207.1 hypothetical protein BZL42_08400 [Pseudomonas indica]
MSDFRPLPSLSTTAIPVLYANASLGAHELFEAGQERLNAARQLALVLFCNEPQLDNGEVFAAFHLLLNDAAGLYDAAFERVRRG